MKTETCGRCGASFSWDNQALFGGSPELEWFSYLCPLCSREKKEQERHKEREANDERRFREQQRADAERDQVQRDIESRRDHRSSHSSYLHPQIQTSSNHDVVDEELQSYINQLNYAEELSTSDPEQALQILGYAEKDHVSIRSAAIRSKLMPLVLKAQVSARIKKVNEAEEKKKLHALNIEGHRLMNVCLKILKDCPSEDERALLANQDARRLTKQGYPGHAVKLLKIVLTTGLVTRGMNKGDLTHTIDRLQKQFEPENPPDIIPNELK